MVDESREEWTERLNAEILRAADTDDTPFFIREPGKEWVSAIFETEEGELIAPPRRRKLVR